MKNKYLFVVWILSFVILASGCDAFVRKFTRKSKKDNLPQEEMILAPQEYKPLLTSKEEIYRQYLLYWKSWHDELLEALLTNVSQKKKLDCAFEAIKNLQEMEKILNPDKRQKLQAYIQRLDDIRASIEADSYGTMSAVLRLYTDTLRRDILRDFSYKKVKDSLQ